MSREKNDVVTKNFETFPDVAADIINVWTNLGEHRVCEKNIFPAPTETVYQGKDSMRSQLEDVSKYEMVDGKINAQYLFANQTSVDQGMILRKAGYLGAFYREQYDGKVRGTFPVMELIMYWGKRRWNSSHDMKQFFQELNLPQKVWEHIDNLKLDVWEMRYLPKEIREQFMSDMRIVVDCLAEGIVYRSKQKIVHKEALIKLLRVLFGDENVDDTPQMLADMNIREEDEITMCELFDQYTRKGINLGISQGISQGISKGIQVLITTCKELGASFDVTADKVRTKYNLEDAEVQKNMKLYW